MRKIIDMLHAGAKERLASLFCFNMVVRQVQSMKHLIGKS